jgi:regulator of protease activity HflC (stomatin/prohibitin superfamily)
MAWEFWVSIVLAIPTLVALIVWLRMPKTIEVPVDRYGDKTKTEPSESRMIAGFVTTVGAVLTLIFLFLACFTIVGTKNVGIQTSFNRPIGTMSNGWNWKAPWTSVTEWDGKLQNLRFSDTDKADTDDKDHAGPGVSVRLGNQSTATIDLILQYRLTTDAGVEELFRQYGDEASLKRNLVQKSLQAAVNQAFKTYDPITALAGTAGRTPTQGMPELASAALAMLRGEMPSGIEVVSLTIVMPHYDAQTEDRIKAFNAAIQDTAIAKQREQTAAAIKAANDILTQSHASAEVLYQNCLDMVERVVKSGGSLPAGFSCSSGGSVVIPATPVK